MPMAEQRAAVVIDSLRRYRFAWSTEKELQEGLAEVLALLPALAGVVREHTIAPGSIIDFYWPEGPLAGLGLEVKIRCPRAALLRQLHRYAEHKTISELLLVTPSLRLDVPPSLCGKPAFVHRIPTL